MTVINMLRALIENLNNIQKQMDKSKKRGKSLKQSKDNTIRINKKKNRISKKFGVISKGLTYT